MKDEKREMTIEELEAEYKKVSEQYDNLGAQIKKKKQEEEDRKKEQLAAEKDARHKEIEEVGKHLNELIKNYTKDYGSFSFSRRYSNDGDYIFRLPYWFL